MLAPRHGYVYYKAMMYNPEKPFHDSLEAMMRKAEALQPALHEVAKIAESVFERLMPEAPVLLNSRDDVPYFSVSSMNTRNGIPISRSLVIRSSEDETLEINRYNSSNPNRAVLVIDHITPYEADETLRQSTRIKQFHDDSTATFPYDVEVHLYDKKTGLHSGFVGQPYTGMEPYIVTMLDELAKI